MSSGFTPANVLTSGGPPSPAWNPACGNGWSKEDRLPATIIAAAVPVASVVVVASTTLESAFWK